MRTALAAGFRLVTLSTSLALFGACSFDTTGLDERLCNSAIDCEIGQTCSDGVCVGVQTGDVDIDASDVGADTADSGAPDAGIDASTDASDAGPDAGECTPGEAFCEGNVVAFCTEDATLDRLNCLSVSNCPDGEFGCYCDAGACVPRVCSPGTNRCGDDQTVESCTTRGDAWTPSATCSDDEICIGDACIDRQCSAGTTTCSGETIVVCDDDGQIADTTDCLADGAWCDDRGDTPICTPRVCTPAEARCAIEGEAVESCDGRGTAFDPPVPCEGATFCADGLCEPQVCVPGTSGCADAFSYEICDARGTTLERTTCDAGQYCAVTDGVPGCEPWICEPGTTICAADGEAVQTCNAAGSAYGEPTDCGDDQFCASGICSRWVCTPGESLCDGLFAIRTCDDRGAGSVVTTCAEGRFCDDDGAAPTCAPQRCEPGTRRCEGDGVATCDEAGSSFAAPVACGEAQICLDGACEDVICAPSAATCADDATRQVCNETGTTLTTELCPAETFCAEGVCTPWVCTPDSVACDGFTSVQTCDAIGSAATTVACASGQSCRGGTCVDQVCTPGAETCVDDTTVGTCDPSGLVLTETACGPSETCDAGACEPWVCTPGTATCADATTTRTCSDDGLSATDEACGAGDVCSAGACIPDETCVVGALFCDGDDLVRCAADGEVLVETCALGCAEGACIAGCGDSIIQSGETCDDGNDNPCDGCDGCQIDGGLQMTASTTTSSPAAWTPGPSDLTIEVWAQVTSAGQLIGVGEGGFDHAILGIDESGAPYFSMSLDPGENTLITGPTSIIDGAWHHIAGVRWNTNILWLFVDGQFVAATTNPLDASQIDRGQIWVGDYASEPGSPAVAILGDARISNVRRYNSSFAPPRIHPADGSTIAAYRFDQAVAASGGAQVWSSTSGSRNLTVRSTAASAACYGASPSEITCGDGALAPWEVCDDGGTAAGDGCNAACMIECGRTIGPFHNCYDWNIVAQTWVAWRDTCRGRGAELLTLETALEDYWVRNWVFSEYGDTRYWIGLNDLETEGTFEWVSGSTATFRLWADGEPNDFSTGEDCVEALPRSGWNDLACGTSLNSICEYPTD